MSFIVLNCPVVEWVDIFANLVFKKPGISKWQTQLPCLRLETLRVHNSFSENYKNSTKKNQLTDAILYNQASQICACVESSGKVQGHFLWDPGPINATISIQKIDFAN